MENQEQPAHWSRAELLAFRFAFVYLILYYLPFPFGAFPRTGRVAQEYESLWQKLVPWFGRHVLHLNYEILTNTNCSGDTTYEYARVLCFFGVAFAASLLWSLLDRSSSNHQRMHEWLRSYVRLSVGAAMLMYGAAKIFLQHFPPPNLYKLLEPLGNYSQMSLLWTFMGASRGYSVFAGCLQMLAGILLFIPRLTTLGALVAIAVFTNIFALNLGYDLPVKLYSLHIILVCFFLVLGLDARINHPGVFIVGVRLLVSSSISAIHCCQHDFLRSIFVLSAVEQSKPGRPASTEKRLPFRLRDRGPTRFGTAVKNNQLALVYQVGHLSHRYAHSIRTDRYRLAEPVLFRAATSGCS